MWRRLRRDVQVFSERDPACRSALEALLCHSGLHALLLHRAAHALYRRRRYLAARLLSQAARWLTGIEIHPGARIGEGCFIDHGTGVVIGETAELGRDVTLYQGVTLGGTGKEKGKRHPTVGSGVVIGAGAKVLGSITLGDNCRVGAGAVVVRPVPPDSTVVGSPGQIVRQEGRHVEGADLDHGNLPDPLAETLAELEGRARQLEERIARLEASRDEERAI